MIKLITFSNNLCTIGKLYLDGELICHTMERPWLHNRTYVSCIPTGVYDVQIVSSPKFGVTYQVLDVTGRTHILFHKANRPSELEGCIAPVSSYGILGEEWAGMQSAIAYEKLMKALNNEDHKMIIERH